MARQRRSGLWADPLALPESLGVSLSFVRGFVRDPRLGQPMATQRMVDPDIKVRERG